MRTTIATWLNRNFFSAATLYLAISTPVVLIGWNVWDASRNHGLNYGYYGELNRMKLAITSMPDVRVVDCSFKSEWSIECIYFNVKIPSRPEVVRLHFHEGDSIRRMAPDDIQAELRRRLALPVFRRSD